MLDALKATLNLKYGPQQPQWVTPFLAAAAVLDELEAREQHKLKVGEFNVLLMEGKFRGRIPPEMRKRSDPNEEPAADVLARVEAMLQQAANLCAGQDALPYTWLALVRIRQTAWSRAREAALQAVNNEPYSVTLLHRLVSCYEEEKDYINAHRYLERALSLTPSFDRTRDMARLQRLSEQADDARNHVVRVDPFQALSLEMMASVMRYGLVADRYFVLKCSWVCQKWRNTLNRDCPDLWGTLTIDPKSFKDKTQNEKRNAWIGRCGITPHTVKLEDLVLSSVTRIPKGYDEYLRRAKTIEISVKKPLVLSRLAEKWSEPCEQVQSLTLDGGYAPNSKGVRGSGENPPVELTCGLLSYKGKMAVQDIELKNVDYVDRIEGGEYKGRDMDSMRQLKDYTSLKRLSVQNCAIPNVYRPGVLGNVGANTEYQIDVLHRALRRAFRLEYLEVIADKETCSGGRAAQPGQGRIIDFPILQTIRIPPPGHWSIDVRSLSLQTLAYVVPQGFNKYHYTQSNAKPLLPDVQHLPAPVHRLGLLKHLEVECTSADDISQLQGITAHLPGLTHLVVRSFGYPYPRPTDAMSADTRAQIQILVALESEPRVNPNLEKLRLEFCHTPDDRLISLVMKRKAGNGLAPLKRLELRGCSQLKEETRAFLAQEVPHFVCEHEMPVFSVEEEDKKEELLRRLACL